MENLKEIIRKYRKAYHSILSATDWTKEYLKHGNVCDSGEDASFKIEFVIKAQYEFISEHKNEILQLAADKIKTELASIGIDVEELENE